MITLVTGDRVTLTADGALPRAAKGREHIKFVVDTDARGDVHVTPSDTLSSLKSGRLDPRLFDVTQLVADGYADDVRADIPLIVGARGMAVAAQVTRDLPSIGSTAVKAAKDTKFWTSPIARQQRILLDGKVKASLDRSVPQIGAPEAWKAGFTGGNTKVAILDTGIDTTHPDLADAIDQAKDFTGSPNGMADKVGHGTHMASIVTGEHPKYRGVAPDVRLMVGKVLDDNGFGSDSQIIAGMEWAATSGAKVINMSLGSLSSSDGTDPMSQAVNTLTTQTGALFVIAAGNSGLPVSAPGAADAALTVDAVDHDDNLAPFSSRGPRFGDNAVKPEITAPGVGIVAAMAKGSEIEANYPHVDDTHVALDGTSMATPHVTGATAILAGEHPGWRAEQLKSALTGSAKPNPALGVFNQGAGRVDVAKAVKQQVRVTPETLTIGTAQWPHNDDQPVDKTLTLHNDGTAPVTVPLTQDIKGPDGKPAPAGDIRIPLSVDREVESYTVKLTFVGFDGKPTSNFHNRFINLDKRESFDLAGTPEAPGVVVARVPKGRYMFAGWMTVDETGQPPITARVEPEVVLDKDWTATIDARQGVRPAFTIDKPNARINSVMMRFGTDTVWGGEQNTGMRLFAQSIDDVLVQPSSTAHPGQFQLTVESFMAAPDGKGGFSTSPYQYKVRKYEDGRVPSTMDYRVRDQELVRARAEFAATKPDAVYLGRALGEAGCLWYEEPMREFSISAYQLLATTVDVPLLVAETSDGAHMNSVDFIRAGAVTFGVRASTTQRGGITGAMRTAHLADAYRLRAEVHGSDIPNQHLCMAISNNRDDHPSASLVLPVFLELNQFGLIGTIWSVVLPLSFFPFGVYLVYIYFATSLPREIIEAARIDGCSQFQIFSRIALPLAKPVAALVAFFSFVGNWNNFFLPYLVLPNSDQFPLQVGLNQLLSSTPAFNPVAGGGLNITSPELALAILIAVTPVLVLFLFSQRALVSGMLAGSTKG